MKGFRVRDRSIKVRRVRDKWLETKCKRRTGKKDKTLGAASPTNVSSRSQNGGEKKSVNAKKEKSRRPRQPGQESKRIKAPKSRGKKKRKGGRKREDWGMSLSPST